MKKHLIALAAATLVALPLAACSSATPEDTGTSGSTSVPGNEGGAEKETASEVVFDTTSGVSAENGTPITVKLPDELVEQVDEYQTTPFESVTVETIMLDSMENCAIKLVYTPRDGIDHSWITEPTNPDPSMSTQSPLQYAAGLIGMGSFVDEPAPLEEFSGNDPDTGTYIDVDSLTTITVERCGDDLTDYDHTLFLPGTREVAADKSFKYFGNTSFEFASDSAGNMVFPMPRDDGQPGPSGYYLNSAGKWMKG